MDVKSTVRLGLFLFLMLAWAGTVAAQTVEDKPFRKKSESPTKAIDSDVKVYHKDHDPPGKQIRYIIKKDTRGTLSGNKCATDETRKMGFEYMTLTKGDPGYPNEFDRWRHNFGVKTILFFSRGPFWKVKVNKKIKECRFKTGDYVG